MFCRRTVERVRWLWHGYLPRGKLVIMAGPAGTSKTTGALAIAATLTQSGRWPDGTRAEAGDVLIWSGEDGIADTLLPRLMAHEADLSRVHFVGDVTRDGERRPFDPACDMPDLLLAAARIPHLRLVIIDPVILAVRGGTTQHERRRAPWIVPAGQAGRNDRRRGYRHHALFQGHRRQEPDRADGCSLAFAAAARVVLAVARIPDDQGGGRVMLRAKNNLGPDEGGFRFDIRRVDVAGAEAVRIEWGEPIAGSALDILTAAERQTDPDERTKGDDLADLLCECLTEAGGEMERRALLADPRRPIRATASTRLRSSPRARRDHRQNARLRQG